WLFILHNYMDSTGLHNIINNALNKALMLADNQALALMLEDITKSLTNTLGVDSCHVNLDSIYEKKIYIEYPAKDSNNEELNDSLLKLWRIQLSSNPLHYINREFTNSVFEDEFLNFHGLKSAIVMPVKSNYVPVGYLCLGSKGDQNWSEYVEKSLEVVTRLISMAVDKIALHDQIRIVNEFYQSIINKSFQRIDRILSQVVDSLAATVRFRDYFTSEHLRRTTRLAVAIADTMGLSNETIHTLSIASVLHDIGKLAIPMSILNKPSKLTADEHRIIKSHCQIGYKITKGIELPGPVSQIILQHHERMDGSGYPLGLCGNEILMEARILAVADMVDTMMYPRPYQAPLSKEEALGVLSKYKGVLYDEEAVNACIAVMKETDFEFDENDDKWGRLLHDSYYL
ncbi:MAG TPA: HD domain-containing protein, partial [Tissierellia bacterium]|nr:HD domain-containing protein [Tissierellia bacterium]